MTTLRDETVKARKDYVCDLCKGTPECVEICPENAIQYLEQKNNSGGEQ